MTQPHTRRLRNDHPMFLLRSDGAAHRLTVRGDVTQCGKSAVKPIPVTFAEVHVWLGHRFCHQCFDTAEVAWP